MYAGIKKVAHLVRLRVGDISCQISCNHPESGTSRRHSVTVIPNIRGVDLGTLNYPRVSETGESVAQLGIFSQIYQTIKHTSRTVLQSQAYVCVRNLDTPNCTKVNHHSSSYIHPIGRVPRGFARAKNDNHCQPQNPFLARKALI